jgi:hypothetical protein
MGSRDAHRSMVGIDAEHDPEKVRRFVRSMASRARAVYKPDLGYSTTYVLDRDYRVAGAHSEEYSRVKEAPCR